MASLRFSDPIAIKRAADARGGHVTIGHNRWARTDGQAVFFGLHGTDLVEWRPSDGTIRVRHGGWRTATTRAAIADFLSLFGRANAADKGGEAMLRGVWRPVGREFEDFEPYVI